MARGGRRNSVNQLLERAHTLASPDSLQVRLGRSKRSERPQRAVPFGCTAPAKSRWAPCSGSVPERLQGSVKRENHGQSMVYHAEGIFFHYRRCAMRTARHGGLSSGLWTIGPEGEPRQARLRIRWRRLIAHQVSLKPRNILMQDDSELVRGHMVLGFLYGVMKEVVYCVMPEGMKLVVDFDCLELVKTIYGLK
ncbi:hypothetical protein F443_20148 [Phytophthora nicotianae P1569]|uniref:Uncharacterized protein n=1 Tax=Phytophthora nicotianae P1569 TaxID=1317065 RepID=V9E3Q0_PHYNI|nr:hypothetical protein F443_20148 [Phytophthora nicotianae P1569]